MGRIVLEVLVLLVLGSTKKGEAGESARGAGTGIIMRDIGEVEAGDGVGGAKRGKEEEEEEKRRNPPTKMTVTTPSQPCRRQPLNVLLSEHTPSE